MGTLCRYEMSCTQGGIRCLWRGYQSTSLTIEVEAWEMFITLDLITTTAGPTIIQEVSHQPNEQDELSNIDQSGHGRSWSEGDCLSFRLDKTSGMSDDVLQDTTASEPGAFHRARLSDKPHIPHIPYPSSGLGSAIGPPSTKVPILLFERSRFNWLWVPGKMKREPINAVQHSEYNLKVWGLYLVRKMRGRGTTSSSKVHSLQFILACISIYL